MGCLRMDIIWMPPHWRLKRFIMYSTSKSYVLLPGLCHSSFYFGDRIMRQFGRAQRVPLPDFPLPTVEVMDAFLARSIDGYWNCRLEQRSIEVGNPIESIFLDETYLEWLIPRVEAEYVENIAGLASFLKGSITNGVEDRLREARGIPYYPSHYPLVEGSYPDPLNAPLARDFRRRRGVRWSDRASSSNNRNNEG